MIYLILDNIRSVYNVGSIFRTADAAGVSKIYLCGVTPAPIDRFGRKRKDVAKVALGAEESVSWESTKTTEDAINKLKDEGCKIVAVEQSSNSIHFKNHKPTGNTTYVFGNEVEGLSADIMKISDHVIEIPMVGKKESLNVSVAVGIILFNTK